MDDKLIARLQKDLDGFTTYYDNILNQALSNHAQNIQPTWGHLRESLLKRAKQLYGEADALDENLPPVTRAEKFRALNYEAKRLENLATDMAEDIKKVETQLQPYFTSAIGHEFEKSFYMTAWGTEQALKVGVQTPLLTPNRIYGVLANPWLPDGKTYSQRLRINTTYLAGKMRGTMAEATAYGWGWNETARRIQEVAQEGYFNSVRLARTEMVRASNLGASYAYMENSDILDGKRWNATLDSKTAPKDADNDGEIFDLDYDTPENPGVAGKRIPNHPNCRCRYSPVISALGVQDKKGRIAKDPKDKSREYFKGNYKEWAKFKGLPDLDERLKAENPAKYLRPGETAADLNKQVVRKKINNREITLPRPMWERLEKPPTTVVPVVESTTLGTLDKLPINKNSSIFQKVGEVHYNSIQAIAEKAPKNVRQVWADFESRITVKDANSWEHPHYSQAKDGGIVLHIDHDAKGSRWEKPYSITFHESGHNIDNLAGAKAGKYSFEYLSCVHKNGLFQMTLKEEVDKHIDDLDKILKAEFKAHKDDKEWLKSNGFWTSMDDFNERHGIPVNIKYTKSRAYFNFEKKLRLIPEENRCEISDIVEGCTKARVAAGFGHGKSYWEKMPAGVAKEAFANFFEATMCNPESRKVLNEYLPKSAKIFEEILEEAIKGVME